MIGKFKNLNPVHQPITNTTNTKSTTRYALYDKLQNAQKSFRRRRRHCHDF